MKDAFGEPLSVGDRVIVSRTWGRTNIYFVKATVERLGKGEVIHRVYFSGHASGRPGSDGLRRLVEGWTEPHRITKVNWIHVDTPKFEEVA
jgi:hypothetical protein